MWGLGAWKFKARHNSECGFPVTETLGFFQSVAETVKEMLQPSSHFPLYLKSRLGVLQEQLQPAEM